MKTKKISIVIVALLSCHVILAKTSDREIVELRTPNSKTYQCSNGKFKTVITFSTDNLGTSDLLSTISSDTSISEILSGSPHKFTQISDSQTYYSHASITMRVGRSDYTKNNMSWYNLVTNPIYTNCVYRAFSVWDISGVGKSAFIDSYGISVDSVAFKSKLYYNFKESYWSQTVYLKYGDMVFPEDDYAKTNYNTFGSATTVASITVSGTGSSANFNVVTSGNLCNYIEQLRENEERDLDLLFQASDETSRNLVVI